ncbi:MAG TPA: polysaccharide deacetylase family protein [Ktedonobacteraceae bacterium]|nr:polysaccharide deacetylase family protein [Ktedonobacteraceae bacterium]
MQGIDQPPSGGGRHQSGIRRTQLLIMLSIFMFVSGSLTLTFADAPTAELPGTHGLNYGTASGSGSTPDSNTSPTSALHPSSTPIIQHPAVPMLAPITPFPLSLPQELATLEANGRFFYRGNPNLPEVSFTFDDGPNPPYTSQILAVLRHYGIPATFFDVGTQVQAYPNLVRQEYDSGYTVGNHTWGHANLPALSAPGVIWQLTTDQDIIEHTIGVRPVFFRPPYGAFNALTLQNINKFGLVGFIWSVDPRDWSRPGVRAIVATVLAETGNGSIILMHDGGGNRSQTVAALPIVIEALQQRGFHFVSLQQLISDAHQPAPTNATPTPSPQQERWRRRLQAW